MSLSDRIRSLLRRPPRAAPMSCRELVDLVTEHLEGTLPTEDDARLRAHLAACDACTAYLAQMRDTLELLGRVEPEDVSEEAYAELSGVFVAWKAERGA